MNILSARMSGASDAAERRLLNERQEVIQEIFAQALSESDFHTGLQETDSGALGPMRELEFSRRELLNRRLRQLDDALGRVHSGQYGICADCGVSIADKRLEADPAAALCVGCQSADEEAVPAVTL